MSKYLRRKKKSEDHADESSPSDDSPPPTPILSRKKKRQEKESSSPPTQTYQEIHEQEEPTHSGYVEPSPTEEENQGYDYQGDDELAQQQYVNLGFEDYDLMEFSSGSSAGGAENVDPEAGLTGEDDAPPPTPPPRATPTCTPEQQQSQQPQQATSPPDKHITQD